MKRKRALFGRSRIGAWMMLGVASIMGPIGPACAADDIFAVQSRLSTPPPADRSQLFNQINDDSTVGSSGTLSANGGVYAGTFLNGIFYGIELENGTFVDYLVTIPHEGPLFGQASRVSASTVGFPDVEAIVNCNGTLIGASVHRCKAQRTARSLFQSIPRPGWGPRSGRVRPMS